MHSAPARGATRRAKEVMTAGIQAARLTDAAGKVRSSSAKISPYDLMKPEHLGAIQ